MDSIRTSTTAHAGDLRPRKEAVNSREQDPILPRKFVRQCSNGCANCSTKRLQSCATDGVACANLGVDLLVDGLRSDEQRCTGISD